MLKLCEMFIKVFKNLKIALTEECISAPLGPLTTTQYLETTYWLGSSGILVEETASLNEDDFSVLPHMTVT